MYTLYVSFYSKVDQKLKWLDPCSKSLKSELNGYSMHFRIWENVVGKG